MSRPRRLDTFSYIGQQRYFLTFCVRDRHVHLLVEGLSLDSDFKRFAKMAKQRSGSLYARSRHQPLWQAGYHERVLRDEDDAGEFARYVVNNPVRAGLVESPEEYPLSGSEVWSMKELLQTIV